MAAPTSRKEEPNFEAAMESLEKIVAEMESDTLPLEQLLVRYEEGLKLVKLCAEKLEAAEKKIEMISRTADGKLKAVEFPGAAGGGTEPSTRAEPSATEESSAGNDAPRGDVRLF